MAGVSVESTGVWTQKEGRYKVKVVQCLFRQEKTFLFIRKEEKDIFQNRILWCTWHKPVDKSKILSENTQIMQDSEGSGFEDLSLPV